MELTALLCNHAEAQNNLLYLSGGGFDRVLIPAGQPGPWPVSLAVGMIVEVPWTQTNQEHSVRIALQDADGHPVEVLTSPTDRQPFGTEIRFNVGRPPQLEVGESQSVALAVNVPVLPFEKLGQYTFVISIDGTELQRLSYRLVGQPGITITPSGLGGAQVAS
ncbi:DUF6941 family protein [Candidatus Mycobacterium methanotrophicum]|uniref:Uncharacterized protein n=1 Tax=Candidatus Mycobacterium methanotrophicum TaxID=2943498 RepID=A0ABY4QGA6_9MYCO|nr:hypothetical protein [Candidatus Mycobacterium methanotrophicum]UQX10040.1 hypothetical protein M5I08_17705 [Candidatus Mycobacterium methanotrophicum]